MAKVEQAEATPTMSFSSNIAVLSSWPAAITFIQAEGGGPRACLACQVKFHRIFRGRNQSELKTELVRKQ